MIVWLAACGAPTPPPGPPTPELLAGPTIEHELPTEALLDGASLSITATATDEDGVENMELRYRVAGELFFERVVMEQVQQTETTATYTAAIEVEAPGVEYVLRAFDASDWRIPSSFPDQGASDPVHLNVSPIPLSTPFFEDFDGEVEYGLYGLGWTEEALAFRGRRWSQSELAFEGTHSARHRAGSVGMEPVDDWLVSPLLSLAELSTAEVRWVESGGGDSVHELWLSTGSKDPADFVQVVALDAPSGTDWSQSGVVDLSAWAGASAVRLAWRYQAEGAAEAWAIDDVRVRAFAPDLQLVHLASSRVEPGGSGTVSVEVQNFGAPTLGPVLFEATVTLGQAALGGPFEVAALGTGEGVQLEIPVVVDPAQPDNTLLQAELVATDGVDGFRWPFAVLVGDPSAGLVRLQVLDPGLVQVWLGVGDPAAPVLEELVFQGQLSPGVYTLSADLGDHVQWLPSVAGRSRWWTKLRADTRTRLLGFGIDHDGVVQWSDDVGTVPTNADGLFYLPARARPTLVELLPDPAPLAPGSTGLLRLVLDNPGGAMVGYAEARIQADPALGLGTDTVRLPRDWQGPAVLELPVAVDAAHTDSQPLSLHLDIVDSGEAYPLDVVVPVPWPRLIYGSPVVNEVVGNGDGVFDPGEQVDVVVPVRNEGALTTGMLSCRVTQTGGPVVHFFPVLGVGPMEPGVLRFLNIPLTTDGVAEGDNLSFEVVCTDAARSWPNLFAVDVGGVPWGPLPDDPTGDALPGASFDLRQARFRVHDGLIELEFTGLDPIDPNTLNLELWAASPGGTWRNMVVTVQDGVAALWGVQSGGFNPLGDPQLTVSGNTVRIGLPEAELGLAEQTFRVAVGTGFCGTADLYCDHWPDGWGNPYATAPNANHFVTFTW